MNEKQQIAEAERRFENWWYSSKGMDRLVDTVLPEQPIMGIKDIVKEAWMNGAFVARENN